MKRLEFLEKLDIIIGERKKDITDPNADIDIKFEIDGKEVKIRRFCLTSLDERVIEFESLKGK